jgi:hypothetical protein
VSTSTELADRLDQVVRAYADYLAGLSLDQWRARCGNHPTIRVGDEDENRPVGTVAHHTAVALPRILGMVRAIAAGAEVAQPSRGGAAAHAQANPDPDQGETVALLRANGAEAATSVRALSDDDLARTGRTMIGELSAGDAVERILIGHLTWHEGSIRATVGDPLQ